jgi:DNA-directed RNA polymerase subunit L
MFDDLILTDWPASSIEEGTRIHFSLYPNPTTDYVNIDAQGENITHIEVLDQKGLLMFSSTDNAKQLDIAHLSAGIYFIKIQTERGVGVRKLIKE